MDRLEKIYENAAALLMGGTPLLTGQIVCIGICDLPSACVLQEQTGSAVLSVSDDKEQGNSLAAGGIRTETVPDYSGRSMEAFFSGISQDSVRAIFIAGVLEYAKNTVGFLWTLHRYLQNTKITAVACVTNYSQYDIACRTIFSDMEGLQKDAARNLYDEDKLFETIRSAGFHTAKSNDLYLENSDIPLSVRNTAVFHYLSGLRVSESWRTRCFIRMLEMDSKSVPAKKAHPHPFLSVVTRTTGSRPQELKEVLLCLSAQTCQNFEVLVVGHNLESSAEESVKNALHHAPPWIREKIRFVPVGGGGRSAPLNAGFENAAGDYITILDDDDLVFSNWVQTFRELAETNDGKILKSVTVRQEYDRVQTVYSPPSSAAVSGFVRDYPVYVDSVQMLHHNQCPGLCLAFPAAVIRKFGFRFDETLNTTEDWDFILRVLPVCGMAASPEITNIYRWWRKGNSSATLYRQKEWSKNYESVLSRMDRSYLLLPPGSAKEIVSLIGFWGGHCGEAVEFGFPDGMAADEKRNFIRRLLNSRSWKLMSFFRKAGRFFGKKSEIPSPDTVDEKQLDSLLQSILRSGSWHSTEWLRRLKSFLKKARR